MCVCKPRLILGTAAHNCFTDPGTPKTRKQSRKSRMTSAIDIKIDPRKRATMIAVKPIQSPQQQGRFRARSNSKLSYGIMRHSLEQRSVAVFAWVAAAESNSRSLQRFWVHHMLASQFWSILRIRSVQQAMESVDTEGLSAGEAKKKRGYGLDSTRCLQPPSSIRFRCHDPGLVCCTANTSLAFGISVPSEPRAQQLNYGLLC